MHSISVAGLAFKLSWDLLLVEVHLEYHKVCPQRASIPEEARRLEKKEMEVE
jgi:hypothetical protein